MIKSHDANTASERSSWKKRGRGDAVDFPSTRSYRLDYSSLIGLAFLAPSSKLTNEYFGELRVQDLAGGLFRARFTLSSPLFSFFSSFLFILNKRLGCPGAVSAFFFRRPVSNISKIGAWNKRPSRRREMKRGKERERERGRTLLIIRDWTLWTAPKAPSGQRRTISRLKNS